MPSAEGRQQVWVSMSRAVLTGWPCKARSATDDDDGFAAAESHVRELGPLHHLLRNSERVTWHLTEECRVPGLCFMAGVVMVVLLP